MPNSLRPSGPPVELSLARPAEWMAVAAVMHLPGLAAGLMAEIGVMSLVLVVTLASLAWQWRKAQRQPGRILWYPSGAAVLLGPAPMPCMIVKGQRLGSQMLLLDLETGGCRQRVMALRRGQENAFRGACCRIYGLQPASPVSNGGRSRPESVV